MKLRMAQNRHFESFAEIKSSFKCAKKVSNVAIMPVVCYIMVIQALIYYPYGV
jgi:hypothetical protein